MKISLKPYTGGSAQMNYESFAKWWQYNPDFKSLKLNDPRSIRRIDCAAIFKSYDGNLAGAVKISNFGFIFKSLVENKHISTKIVFRDVLTKLDTENDGNIYLNAFIAWIEGDRASESISTKSPVARLTKKLTRGAAVVVDTISLPVRQLSRTNSPGGTLGRADSSSTAISAITENTTAGEKEKGTDRDSFTLQSLGRGSIYADDGMLDLTQTELESPLPPLPNEEYPYREADEEGKEVVKPFGAPAKRDVSAQRAKTSKQSAQPPVQTVDTTQRSELDAIRALTADFPDDSEPVEAPVRHVPIGPSADVANNALRKAAMRRESKSNSPVPARSVVEEVSTSSHPRASAGGIENDYLSDANVAVGPPPANALAKAAARRQSKTKSAVVTKPSQADTAVPPPPPPPPLPPGKQSVSFQPPLPTEPLPPPTPPAPPAPPGVSFAVAESLENSPKKTKVHMAESVLEEPVDDGTNEAKTKKLRAARMKSLYVAVSQRPHSLAETVVTPFGAIKKTRGNSADADLDAYRHSTMSRDDYDEFRPSEIQREIVRREEEEEEEDQMYTEHNQDLYAPDEGEPEGDCNYQTYQNELDELHIDGDGDEDEHEEESRPRAPSAASSHARKPAPAPTSAFSPVGGRKVGFAAAGDLDYDTNESVSTSSTSNAPSNGGNALENALARRRRSSVSPATTKKIKKDAKNSKSSSSSTVFDMFSSIGGGGASAMYTEEAGCTSALEVLQSNSRQPLVRRLFDNYCRSDETMDVNIVQQLCYDVGIYYSLLEIRISIKPFVHNAQYIMTDDSFLVWWRSNNDFSCLKLNDARTVRRVVAAGVFKTYDANLEGKVGIPHFSFVFRDLVASKHISSRVNFDDVVDLLDETEEGVVYLNAFIRWLEGDPSSASSRKKSPLSRLLTTLTRGASIMLSRGNTPNGSRSSSPASTPRTRSRSESNPRPGSAKLGAATGGSPAPLISAVSDLEGENGDMLDLTHTEHVPTPESSPFVLSLRKVYRYEDSPDNESTGSRERSHAQAREDSPQDQEERRSGSSRHSDSQRNSEASQARD
eukprot:gene21224-24086_t